VKSKSLSAVCLVVAMWSCGPEAIAVNDLPDRVVIELRPSTDSLVTAPVLPATTAAGTLGAEKAAVRAAFPDLVVTDELDSLPMLIVHVPTHALLDALARHPLVVQTWPEEVLSLNDAQSFPLIGQPAAFDAGLRGTGATVAVLDTGLDYRKPDFGSCASPGAAGCAVALVRDFAPDDGQLDDNGHGTNVSGIVVGVAPGARVIGLDVFTGGGASSADIISAINWVIANRATYNIVAINMSLGGGSSTTPCATDVFATPVAAARAAGVLSAIASGNNGLTSAISSPGCVPEAISVGAVYDSALGGLSYSTCSDATTAADKVTCFSNSASFLSILAPGALITAGGTTMAGTSQASPHVAGAIAVLAAKFPTDSPSKRASRLLSGATSIRDPRNGVTRPRLTLGANAGACSVTVSPETAAFSSSGGALSFAVTTSGAACGWSTLGLPAWVTANATSGATSATFTLSAPVNTGVARTATVQVAGVTLKLSQAADTTPPTGTVTVARYTKVASVTLTLAASDPSGVGAMCLSTTTSCATFVAYAGTASLTLPSGDGQKTVYAWFRDARGNTSTQPVTAITSLDATAPTNGAVTATASPLSIKLAWSGFADATSGVAKYRVVQSTTTTDAPVSCTAGTILTEGPATSLTLPTPAKTTRRFRVCAIDNAGNVSTGATAIATTP
jgi:Subtilase family